MTGNPEVTGLPTIRQEPRVLPPLTPTGVAGPGPVFSERCFAIASAGKSVTQSAHTTTCMVIRAQSSLQLAPILCDHANNRSGVNDKIRTTVFFQAVNDKDIRKRSVCPGVPLQVSTQACGFPEQTRQIDKQKCQSGKIDECQPMHSVGGGLHLSFCVSGNLRVATSTNAFLPICIGSNCPQTGDRFE